MKNRLCILLMTVITATFGACGGEASGSQSNENESSVTTENVTLNAATEGATGDFVYTLTEDTVLEIARFPQTVLGNPAANVTVLGEGHTITAVGNACNGFICADEGGSLTFKSVTFENETSDKISSDWTIYGLEFGGKLYFENCTFQDEIHLMGIASINFNVDATFKNCTFYSSDATRYSVWISNGSARFVDCKFTGSNGYAGSRGLKLHESFYGDIVKVEVDSCQFLNIVSKPGIVLGTLNESTSILIKNSTFSGCAAWARDGVEGVGGSFEGVDGFYEADNYTSEYDFSYEGNTINGVPDTEVTVDKL